jgi:hypothetical protein
LVTVMKMVRYSHALLALAMAAVPAAAQGSLQQQLSHCLGMTGTLQRLACYDGVAHGAGLTAPAVQAMAPVARAPATYAPVEPASAPQFGSERLAPSPSAPKQANRIRVDVADVHLDLRGKFTVTLANGQVWRQIDGDDAIFKPRSSARSVTIEHAVFGSYALVFNDANARYKVTRVQ